MIERPILAVSRLFPNDCFLAAVIQGIELEGCSTADLIFAPKTERCVDPLRSQPEAVTGRLRLPKQRLVRNDTEVGCGVGGSLEEA